MVCVPGASSPAGSEINRRRRSNGLCSCDPVGITKHQRSASVPLSLPCCSLRLPRLPGLESSSLSVSPSLPRTSICLCGPTLLPSVSFCCFGILMVIGSTVGLLVLSCAGAALFLPLPAPPPPPPSFSGLLTPPALPANDFGGRPRRGLFGTGDVTVVLSAAPSFSVTLATPTPRFFTPPCAASEFTS
ncbi:hypothetical protein JZ751_016440 [Albula glossodonta]|uniref:Uncharacterized protein n=1 Tax=Albula glossodonta TaxID=121402 RepID=A0A8T2NYB7_9TELE|nr:hypothetical protein JZ751_016440 [Albula glossodonta]